MVVNRYHVAVYAPPYMPLRDAIRAHECTKRGVLSKLKSGCIVMMGQPQPDAVSSAGFCHFTIASTARAEPVRPCTEGCRKEEASWFSLFASE